jgi:hypothetical protein
MLRALITLVARRVQGEAVDSSIWEHTARKIFWRRRGKVLSEQLRILYNQELYDL